MCTHHRAPRCLTPPPFFWKARRASVENPITTTWHMHLTEYPTNTFILVQVLCNRVVGVPSPLTLTYWVGRWVLSAIGTSSINSINMKSINTRNQYARKRVYTISLHETARLLLIDYYFVWSKLKNHTSSPFYVILLYGSSIHRLAWRYIIIAQHCMYIIVQTAVFIVVMY